MQLRRILVRTLTPAFFVFVALIAYFAITWPYAPSLESRRGFRAPPRPDEIPEPDYDGTEPFPLAIQGMSEFKLYLDPADKVVAWTILVTGGWEMEETALFIRTVKPGDTVVDAGAHARPKRDIINIE